MELRDGMLGVVIIAVAIAVALFGSYFAGISAYDEEVTKYKYLADVSGEFSYDQSPQYIDFDPSTNYTGYFSTETGEYWPEDYVGFTPNTDTYGKSIANNYKIRYEPDIISSGTEDLDQYTDGIVHPIGSPQVNFHNTADQFYSFNVEVVTLDSLIDAMDIDESATNLEIRSIGIYIDNTSSRLYEASWIAFSTKSMWYDSAGRNSTLWLGSQNWFDENDYSIPYKWVHADGWSYYYYLPLQSVKVDLTTSVAYLYYDNDCQELYTTTLTNDVYLAYGGAYPIVERSIIVYDDSADITVLRVDTDYLNPNYGVHLKDGE